MVNKYTRYLMIFILIGSSFLSFSIQPIFSKLLLPVFGGSSAVWITSSLFFQLILLFSYFYTFFLERINISRRIRLHLVICLIGFIVTQPFFNHQYIFASFKLPELLKSVAPMDQELFSVLRIGVYTVGLSFFLLGTTSIFLQFILLKLEVANPYSYYKYSNLGSLIGIFSYLFVFEPFFPTKWLVLIWTFLNTLILILLVGICISILSKRLNSDWVKPAKIKINVKQSINWVFLSSIPVAIMLSVVNELSLGVSSIPFLWILPFGGYLASYIFAFGIANRHNLYVFISIVLFWLGMIESVLSTQEVYGYMFFGLVLVMLVFFASLVFHQQLYFSRPDTLNLGYFYLHLAFGGLLGSVFVGIVSPIIFVSYIEFNLLCVVGLIVMNLLFRKDNPIKLILGKYNYSIKISALLVISCFVISVVTIGILFEKKDVIYQSRNFYGTLSVVEKNGYRALLNGRILHGDQIMSENRPNPASYYSASSGVGLTMKYLQERNQSKPLRVGVIGLGVGTIASYCNLDDTYVFYEVNQEVIKVAHEYFTYLSNCLNVVIKIGDARVVMAKELIDGKNEKYDLLIIDAFTDDAIPVHLMTKESNELYLRYVEPDGLILYHISNRYFDFGKVVGKFALDNNLSFAILDDKITESSHGKVPSSWAVIGESTNIYSLSQKQNVDQIDYKFVEWTDDRSNLFEIIKW